jgi:hypothetical protein
MGSDGSHTIQKRKPELDAGLAPARPGSGECRSPCEPGIFRRPDQVALIPNRLLIAATRERPLQAIIALRSKMIPVLSGACSRPGSAARLLIAQWQYCSEPHPNCLEGERRHCSENIHYFPRVLVRCGGSPGTGLALCRHQIPTP